MKLLLKSITFGIVATSALGLTTYGIAHFITFLQSKGDIYPFAFLLVLIFSFLAFLYYFIHR